MSSNVWLELGEATLNLLIACAFGLVVGVLFFWVGGWMAELVFPGIVVRGNNSVGYTELYPIARGVFPIIGFSVGVWCVLMARLREALSPDPERS